MGEHDTDPVRTEVVRHGLDSAADQMKRALVRTAELACAKTTRLAMPAGTLLELHTGGGYGEAAHRDPEAVRADRAGYVSEERARADYPHAFRPRS